MKRKCPRTLDKVILLAGLEIEDLALLALGCGAGCVLFGPVLPLMYTTVGWVVLIRFKQNKPAGYVLHCLYTHGVALPGLVPPVNKVKQYRIF